jgi:hypothetical protein
MSQVPGRHCTCITMQKRCSRFSTETISLNAVRRQSRQAVEGKRWDGRRCVPRARPIQPPLKLRPIPACTLGTAWHVPSRKCIKPPG